MKPSERINDRAAEITAEYRDDGGPRISTELVAEQSLSTCLAILEFLDAHAHLFETCPVDANKTSNAAFSYEPTPEERALVEGARPVDAATRADEPISLSLKDARELALKFGEEADERLADERQAPAKDSLTTEAGDALEMLEGLRVWGLDDPDMAAGTLSNAYYSLKAERAQHAEEIARLNEDLERIIERAEMHRKNSVAQVGRLANAESTARRIVETLNAGELPAGNSEVEDAIKRRIANERTDVELKRQAAQEFQRLLGDAESQLAEATARAEKAELTFNRVRDRIGELGQKYDRDDPGFYNEVFDILWEERSKAPRVETELKRAEKAEARVRELEAQRDAAIHGRGKMMDELVADSDARITSLQSEVTHLTAALKEAEKHIVSDHDHKQRLRRDAMLGEMLRDKLAKVFRYGHGHAEDACVAVKELLDEFKLDGPLPVAIPESGEETGE